MAQQLYDFPDHPSESTFEGVTFTVTVNASPMNITGANIRLQLRDRSTGKLYELSTQRGHRAFD